MGLLLLAVLACKNDDKDSRTPEPDSAGESGGTGDSDTGTGDSGEVTDPARFDAILEQASRDLRGSAATGASIAILEGRRITWIGSVGTASPGEEVEINEETLFQIGSDTKKITALALLQQIEAGGAQLDDPVAMHLPGFALEKSPGWEDGATLHHLISHQGGLNDWLTWYGGSDDSELLGFTYGDYQALGYANNPGGALYNYGNPNFILAGAITESLSGRSWVDTVEEDVLWPLGMTRTYGRKVDVEAAGNYALSTGYISIGEQLPGMWDADVTYEYGDVPMEDIGDSAWVRPAGMLWSTPTDQMRLADWLMHGPVEGGAPILSEEGRALFGQGYVEMYPTPGHVQYGYGLMFYEGLSLLSGYYETPVICHGGNTLSMTSTFCMLPEFDFAISILSNGYGDDFSYTLSVAIESLLALPAPSTPLDYTYPAMNLDDYVGEYLDANGMGRISITSDGADLHIDMPDLEAAGFTVNADLTPYYTDIFFVSIEGVDYDLTFIDGDDGAGNTVESRYVRNRQFVGTRTEAPGGPVAVAPERVRRLLDAIRPW